MKFYVTITNNGWRKTGAKLVLSYVTFLFPILHR